jgi:hypothetical protein
VDEIDRLVGVDAEVVGDGSVCLCGLLQACAGKVARGGDDRPASASGQDQAGGLEFPIGTCHGVDGEPKVAGELANGGQSGFRRPERGR